MAKNKESFSPELAALLRDPQAKALMEKIRQLDPQRIREASRLASSGDSAKLRDLLEPLMENEEIQKMSRDLRNRHGGL